MKMADRHLHAQAESDAWDDAHRGLTNPPLGTPESARDIVQTIALAMKRGYQPDEILAEDSPIVERIWAEATFVREAPAAAPAWHGLTEGERNQAVQSICEYGTGFVAPLYAVIEGVERTLEGRNARAPAAAPAAPLKDAHYERRTYDTWFATATHETLGDDWQWAAWKARAALSQPIGAPAAAPVQALTDEQIVAIRDEHLPSQGDRFDCIAFARAVLAAAHRAAS